MADRQPSGHPFVAGFLAVCAALAMTASLPAMWSIATLSDRDRFAAAVAPLADVPAIQNGLVDVVAVAVDDRVPAESVPVIGKRIDRRVDAAVRRVTTTVVQGAAFDTIWTSMTLASHELLLATLAGDGGEALAIEDGLVVLDADVVVTAVLDAMSAQGVPGLDAIDVPESDRVVVVVSAENITEARQAYALLEKVAVWLPISAVLLAIIAMVIARPRARTVITLGITLVAGGLLLIGGLALAEGLIAEQLVSTAFAGAETLVTDVLTADLVRWVWIQVGVGAVLAVGAMATHWWLGRDDTPAAPA